MSGLVGNPFLLTSAGGATGYQIERSLRFNSSDSAYLSRTPASAGNRKTWTWAGWVKRGSLIGTQWLFECSTSATYYTIFALYSNAVYFYDQSNGAVTSTALYRDPGAWMHLVLAVDTTQATASNRVKMYVNGAQITALSGTAYPTQNADTGVNSATLHSIGARFDGSYSLGFNGYLADIHFIDGQALTPSSFTEVSATTGQLIPKAYTGSFGTNGFWLKFSDNSAATATTLGKDYSGNNNNWTPNNLSVTAGAGNDSLVDTPSSAGTDTGAGGEVRGNYCTLNPLDSNGSLTLQNGNLYVSNAAASFLASRGTIAFSTGKWYWEVTLESSLTGSTVIIYGVGTSSSSLSNYVGSDATGYGWYNDGVGSSDKTNNGSFTNYGTIVDNGVVVGIAFDADAGTLTFYRNGTSQGSAFTGITARTYFPMVSLYNVNATINFGQRPFAYPVSGFKALCDTNLPAPVVAKPNQYFGVGLYTGNNGSNTITTGIDNTANAGLLWIKNRTIAVNHNIYDKVRGYSSLLELPTTAAEYSYSVSLAETSTGYTLNTSSAQFNASGSSYVAWNWAAGSSTVTNTQGSITSQVRANASAGFSIVTYTGTGANATVGHGLGVQPGLVVVKRRDSTGNWFTWHTSISATTYLALNTTPATTTLSTVWNNTAPTSTVFSIGTSAGINTSSATYVAYCFAPVAGYSNGFSYTGNGSTDGSFVYLGFRPRLILLKCSSTIGNWTLLDTAREGYNVNNDPLYPNLSDAEGTTDLLDITSNGFKLRTTDASVNSSGATYVGYAWAEAPFAYSRAR